MIGGFTDISINEPFYSTNLSVNKAPFWQKKPENEDTLITRSWDDSYICTVCKGEKRHSFFKKPYFALIISDHYLLSKGPALDGIATCRFQELSLAD